MEIQPGIDAIAQAEAASLLASWVQLPTDTLRASVVDGSLLEGVGALAEAPGLFGDDAADDAMWAEALSAAQSQEPSTLEDLRRDYTRLFTHPKHSLIPIYESQYRFALAGKTDRPLLAVNRTADALDGLYRQWGYQVDRTHAVSADHMAVELTFLAHLWDELQNVWEQEGESDVAVREALEGYLDEHVAPWGTTFFAAVAQEAATPEYRLLGQFGQRLFAARLSLLADSPAE